MKNYNYVDLSFAKDHLRWSTLAYDADINLLNEDIVYIELPNGIYIDVGWYQDSYGLYVCNMNSEDNWNNIEEPFYSTDIHLIVEKLRECYEKYK